MPITGKDIEEKYGVTPNEKKAGGFKKAAAVLIPSLLLGGFLLLKNTNLLLNKSKPFPKQSKSLQEPVLRPDVALGREYVGIPPSDSALFNSFWANHPDELRNDLGLFYKVAITQDSFLRGDNLLVSARILKSSRLDRSVLEEYAIALQKETDPGRKLFVLENISFLKASLGLGLDDFAKAADLASAQGLELKARIYSALSKGQRPDVVLKEYTIRSRLSVPDSPANIVLGLSKITVDAKDIVGVQVDRTIRDWFGKTLNKFPLDQGRLEELMNYHEGARLRDILGFANPRFMPLSGTIAFRHNNKWYAPDDKGIFRFEILEDKIQYPTSKVFGDFAFIEDTHGISSLVQQAVYNKASLVIGCGDSGSKMEAAAYLSQKGIDAYFPCDRHVGEVIGHSGPGTLLGTAPVKSLDGKTAIIGNQPVSISIGEKIIVQDTETLYPAQYYDAPARYFRTLESRSNLKLNLLFVNVDDIKESYKVVKRALSENAHVMGVRVAYEEDYAAVRDWLRLSKGNRAILFHSSAYEPGNRLFSEFPEQTSFGDPRPVFQ